MKKRLEKERKEAIKQSFASKTKKILAAKSKIIMRNTEIQTNKLPRSNTDYGDPQKELEKLIVKAVTLK